MMREEYAKALLRSCYGYDSFRGNQWDIISHTLDGGDSIVLMPTGGGKSLCYQIPGLMSDDGFAIVRMTRTPSGIVSRSTPSSRMVSPHSPSIARKPTVRTAKPLTCSCRAR